MAVHFVTLDVFTTIKFGGNPLGIVHVPADLDLTQVQKQLIAREFNLSESVFLHEQTEDDKELGNVRIDIFTPIAEVPFAGHPTVGTATYLLKYLQKQPEWKKSEWKKSEWKKSEWKKSEWKKSEWKNVKALQTKAGSIPIGLSVDGQGISLQVAHDVHIHDNPFPDTTFSHFPVVSIVKGMTFILARYDSLEDLARPTQSLLGTENTYTSQLALDNGWQQGLISTFFYVDLGVDEHGFRKIRTRALGSREDPATGSASSALCSYLALTERGSSVREYRLTQGVEMGRKSDIAIRVTLNEDGKGVEEVLITGTAVKVMEGILEIPTS